MTPLVPWSFAGSFLLTVFVLQWWPRQAYPAWVFIIPGIALLFAILMRKHARTFGIVCSAIALGISLGFFATGRAVPQEHAGTITFYAHNLPVTLEGWIAEVPEQAGMRTRYVVEAETLSIEDASADVVGKVLIDERNGTQAQYGDRVRVMGNLERPTDDYGTYLLTRGISASMNRATMETVDGRRGGAFFRFLFALRSGMESRLERIYPEPHASFLAGLLIGARSNLPEDVQEEFRTVGVNHILAISGYNITLILGLLSSLLFFLPLRWKLVPLIAAIASFTLLTGASASAVRACVMGVLGVFALHVGRLKDIRLMILWTAFFMTLWNPRMLWDDLGFQLSFLAVIGVTEMQPLLQRFLERIPSTLGLRDALLLTLAAQTLVIPWILLHFGTFSTVSPIANVLIAPFIPLAMLFGFVSLLISMLSFSLGQVIAYLGWAALELIMRITAFFSDIPFASLEELSIPAWTVVMYYAAAAMFLWRMQKKQN